MPMIKLNEWIWTTGLVNDFYMVYMMTNDLTKWIHIYYLQFNIITMSYPKRPNEGRREEWTLKL